MAKQRKTRKDKQQADRRHIKIHQTSPASMTAPAQPGTYSYIPQTASATKTGDKKTIAQAAPMNTATAIIYQYAMQDIRKTAFITFAIVLAQIVVYIIGTHTKIF